MTEVNRILKAIESGDKQAASQLLPLVYEELRVLAKAKLFSEFSDKTLQATDLVHEAYHKLVEIDKGTEERWNSVGHFFGAAAEAMRRILVDRARERSAKKRGGDRTKVTLDIPNYPDVQRPQELLDLDSALSSLEAHDPSKAELVKLRFFAGLTTDEISHALGISPATVNRHWKYARAWLKTEMSRTVR